MRISTSDGPPSPIKLKELVNREARLAGFDCVAIADPDGVPLAAGRLAEFVGHERHGSMEWMRETLARRGHPKGLWPEVRSVIVLGLNYGPDTDPREGLALKDRANISVYARNRDYHEVIKGRLKTVAGKLASKGSCDVKVFVDTAPVMEKPLAENAGLGWQGKHTNLVSREYGSWLFLGTIFTDAELPFDGPTGGSCGSCRACLDACPTNAFPAPFQIDARRCISYLTIENKGPIPHEFRESIGNRVYGCDDCLAACPWNKFAKTASEAKLQARADLVSPPLAEFLGMDDPTFRQRFSGSPVKRIGRDRFLRNVLIAAGNSGEGSLIAPCLALLDDPSPLVRGAAVWALSRLLPPHQFAALRSERLSAEADADVRAEWQTVSHLHEAA
jgi:epoxyqueuosine reductase